MEVAEVVVFEVVLGVTKGKVERAVLREEPSVVVESGFGERGVTCCLEEGLVL